MKQDQRTLNSLFRLVKAIHQALTEKTQKLVLRIEQRASSNEVGPSGHHIQRTPLPPLPTPPIPLFSLLLRLRWNLAADGPALMQSRDIPLECVLVCLLDPKAF